MCKLDLGSFWRIFLFWSILGKKYIIFVPMVNKVLLKHKITNQGYDLLYARVMQERNGSFEDDGLRFPRRRGTRYLEVKFMYSNF